MADIYISLIFIKNFAEIKKKLNIFYKNSEANWLLNALIALDLRLEVSRPTLKKQFILESSPDSLFYCFFLK